MIFRSALGAFYFVCLAASPTIGGSIIDIDSDRSILAFYKANLHPVHMRALEEGVLVVPGAQGDLKVGGLTFSELEIKHLSIDMWSQTQPYLVNIELSPLLPEQAQSLLDKWALLLKQRPKSGLVERLSGKKFEKGDNPFEMVKLGGFKIGTWASAARIKEQRAISLSLSIEYPTDGVTRDLDFKPLRPPPGYEHLPMSPGWPSPTEYPPYKGGQTSTPPKGVASRNPGAAASTPALKQAPKSKTAPTPSKEPSSQSPWSIIVVLIVAAIGLLWLLLNKRR
jgi:hypothetical protein